MAHLLMIVMIVSSGPAVFGPSRDGISARPACRPGWPEAPSHDLDERGEPAFRCRKGNRGGHLEGSGGSRCAVAAMIGAHPGRASLKLLSGCLPATPVLSRGTNRGKSRRCHALRCISLTFCVVSAFLACASPSTHSLAATVTFAVGGAPAEFDHWERVAREFEGEDGIRVELLRQPTDTGLRRQMLTVPLQARVPSPDVFLMDVAWLARFAASGWLEPLSPQLGGRGAREGRTSSPG